MGAYPDFHTFKSSESGNTHGTALAVCTGLEKEHWSSRIGLKTLDFKNVTLVGMRDIDEAEQEIITKERVHKLESV